MSDNYISEVRVENLRGVKDSGYIPLKPITLLVGKNSAGKSSITRIFPLLRQSNEAVRSAPILWWGKYVDYGTFGQALSRHADKPEISFSFAVNLAQGPVIHTDLAGVARKVGNLLEQAEARVRMTITEEGGESHLSSVEISIFDQHCQVSFAQKNVLSAIKCGRVEWRPLGGSADIRAHSILGKFIPDFYFTHLVETGTQKAPIRRLYGGSPLRDLLHSALRVYIHGNSSDKSLATAAMQVSLAEPSKCLAHIREAKGGPHSWKDSAKNFSENSWGFQNIRSAALICALPGLFQKINELIANFSTGVRYMEPIRATAQRFYRPQELSLTEIDPKGDNLAIFLNSFRKNFSFNAFNEWLKEHLDFEVVPAVDGAQIELKIRMGDAADSTNLADMGFGYSQILPIATQLWVSVHPSPTFQRRTDDSSQSTIVIEQPELHLHPAYQGRIADLFVATIKESRVPWAPKHVNIVAETHSSALVNRVGELVAEGIIKREDVQILLFEQSRHDEPATIRTVTYSEDGVLEDWPFGFFAGTYE